MEDEHSVIAAGTTKSNAVEWPREQLGRADGVRQYVCDRVDYELVVRPDKGQGA
jgi:hypothetical protein